MPLILHLSKQLRTRGMSSPSLSSKSVEFRDGVGLNLGNRKEKCEEFIKRIECSDVLLECEQLAAVSGNVCGAAEAAKGHGK